jgi:hypothetical protein
MFTFILLVAFLAAWGAFVAQSKFKIIQKEVDPNSRSMTNPDYRLRINYKPVVFLIAGLIIIAVQPYSVKKIETGYQGLCVSLIGDNRGASNIEEVSGWKFYNTWTQEIHEIPLDLRTIRYNKMKTVAKGGFPTDIHPSFNYAVKPGTTAEMFTHLRSAFRNGSGLETVEQGWLEIAILGAVNDVANKWVVDSIFDNKQAFEAAIAAEANKRVGKWFFIDQLRTNMLPPKSIADKIKEKSAADYAALTSEAQAKAAAADAQRKIALAKGDSATVVIEAASFAKAMKLKQQELTPLYVEYVKAQAWDGKLPTTSLGGNSGSFINLKQ